MVCRARRRPGEITPLTCSWIRLETREGRGSRWPLLESGWLIIPGYQTSVRLSHFESNTVHPAALQSSQMSPHGAIKGQNSDTSFQNVRTPILLSVVQWMLGLSSDEGLTQLGVKGDDTCKRRVPFILLPLALALLALGFLPVHTSWQQWRRTTAPALL